MYSKLEVKIGLVIAVTILITFFSYIMISFVAWDFSPANWAGEARLLLAFICASSLTTSSIYFLNQYGRR